MSRYRGFSEPIEVLIAILEEQEKQTALLEKMAQEKAIPVIEPQNIAKNNRTTRGSNHANKP